jgi:phage terminase small subunit
VKPMTPKQARFIDEYPVDLNATRAAIRAGYSPKTAFVIGYENLKKDLIRSAVRRRLEERAREVGITIQKVLQELSAIAFVNIGDYLEWGRGPTKRELALYKAVSEMALLLCLGERQQRERRPKA